MIRKQRIKHIVFILLCFSGILLVLCGFRMHEKSHLSALADGDIVLVEDASDGCATKYTLMSDIALYLYADNVTSDIQAQLDARCLESVFGTSIGAGILLDGAVLKVSTILQKYHGVDPSATVLLFLADGNATAMRATIGAYGSGDAPVFATVNTGPGATEVYKMDQNVRTTDEVEYLGVNATKFRGVQTANPQIACTDKNCTDGDTSFLIDVNATETGSGAEDIQVKIRAQRNGTMTTFVDIDPENDKIELFSSTSEVSGTVPFMGLLHKTWSFDPKTVCDGAVDRLFLMTVKDDAPSGIIVDEWTVSFEADPATEAVFNLKYADAFIGVANPVIIDVLNTAVGVSSEDTDANINTDGSAIPNGKVMYLEFGTPYTETTHQIIFEMWYHPL